MITNSFITQVIRKGWLQITNTGFMKSVVAKEYWFVLTGKEIQDFVFKNNNNQLFADVKPVLHLANLFARTEKKAT